MHLRQRTGPSRLQGTQCFRRHLRDAPGHSPAAEFHTTIRVSDPPLIVEDCMRERAVLQPRCVHCIVNRTERVSSVASPLLPGIRWEA